MGKHNNFNFADTPDTLKNAVDVFGEQPQLIMAMEEMAELIQAISKYIRGKSNEENIAEEIADVEIMLAQLRYIFNNSSKVDFYCTHKINKLQDLIAKKDKNEALSQLKFHCYEKNSEYLIRRYEKVGIIVSSIDYEFRSDNIKDTISWINSAVQRALHNNLRINTLSQWGNEDKLIVEFISGKAVDFTVSDDSGNVIYHIKVDTIK